MSRVSDDVVLMVKHYRRTWCVGCTLYLRDYAGSIVKAGAGAV